MSRDGHWGGGITRRACFLPSMFSSEFHVAEGDANVLVKAPEKALIVVKLPLLRVFLSTSDSRLGSPPLALQPAIRVEASSGLS